MKAEEFKARMDKAVTYSDVYKLLSEMTSGEKQNLKEILQDANRWVGLTMRDEMLMKSL